MRHLRLALCAVFLLVSTAARADSIPVYQITFAQIFFFAPFNVGSVSFTFNGPGISIDGLANFDCPSGWCSTPDNFVAAGTPINFGSFVPCPDPSPCTNITIGGKTYSSVQVLNPWTMNPGGDLLVPDSGGNAILNGNGLIPGSVITANGTFQF